MYAKVTTTITTEIDLATMTPSHAIEVDSESDALPQEVVLAVVVGACKSAIKTIEEG